MSDPEAVGPSVLSTADADVAQAELARRALRVQRSRLSDLLGSLTDEEWSMPSRCAAWSVHDVARHLCDATRQCASLLGGEPPAAFDPRTTPDLWLEGSASDRPSDTLDRFAATSSELLTEVDRRTLARDGASVPFVFGPTHWTVVVTHVVWDAWVHERDIALPLGRAAEASDAEARVAAAHGVTLAAWLAALAGGADVTESVVLGGSGGGVCRVQARGAEVTSSIDPDGRITRSDVDPLRGELGAVVDALVGRGPALPEVLHGPADRIERLGLFRAWMLEPLT